MKKKLVSIMLVAAMALSVVACGSSKGNSAKTDGTEAMASSVSKTPDNQISINLASEPQSIDPALNSAVDGGCMIVNSFAGLYTYDKDGKLIWVCPQCGNTDQSKMNVARRTCGYIGTQYWNQGRTQEIKDRVLHL